MERIDCVTIGTGVVGIAVAHALALAAREVILLAARRHRTATYSRNCEVIHAFPNRTHDCPRVSTCHAEDRRCD